MNNLKMRDQEEDTKREVRTVKRLRRSHMRRNHMRREQPIDQEKILRKMKSQHSRLTKNQECSAQQ